MADAATSTHTASRLDAVCRVAEAVNRREELAFRIDALAVQRQGRDDDTARLDVGAVLKLRSQCSAERFSWMELLRDRRTIFRMLSEAGAQVNVCDFETLLEQRMPYAVVYGEDPSVVAHA